ncbi:MAG: hypothetical protein ACOYNI_07050 [Acidimicrobiia bacterium]
MSMGAVLRPAIAVGLLVSLAVLPAACSDGEPKKARPTTTTFPTTNKPDPALTQLGELLDEGGALSVENAQRLFAAYVAPLPGVQPLTMTPPAPEDVAGIATRRLSAGAPGVTSEISAAVTRAHWSPS